MKASAALTCLRGFFLADSLKVGRGTIFLETSVWRPWRVQVTSGFLCMCAVCSPQAVTCGFNPLYEDRLPPLICTLSPPCLCTCHTSSTLARFLAFLASTFLSFTLPTAFIPTPAPPISAEHFGITYLKHRPTGASLSPLGLLLTSCRLKGATQKHLSSSFCCVFVDRVVS